MDRSLLSLALRALGSALLLVTLAVPLSAQEPPGQATLRMAGGLFLVPADARLPAAAAGTIVHRYPEANLVRIGTTAALTPALQSRLSAVEESDRAAYRSWTGSYPPLARAELAALPRGYYLARLVGPVDAAWLAQLASAGLDVLDHEAPYTVLLRGGGEGFAKAAGIRTSEGFPVVESLLPLPVEARLSEALLALATGVLAADALPGLLRTADGAVIVRAFPHPGTDAGAVLAAVARYLPRVEPELAWGAEDAFAASGPELLPLLAAIADLAYLEPVHERELHNNLAAKDYILNIEPVWNLGYNGDGVIVGHNDSGVSLSHPDFPAGVIVATRGAMTNTNNEHGTHTAGSVVGRGLAGSSPTNTSGCGDQTTPLSTVRGMAWGARLVTNNIYDGGATDETTMMRWSYSQGARLNTNSWGYGNDFTYSSAAATVDGLVRDADTTAGNQELMILFSAGKSGPGASTVGAPGTAKNVLTVGATQNDRCGSYVPSQQDGPSIDTITKSSSRGPSQGRVKPDVVAVGTDLLSVDSLDCTSAPGDPCEEGWDQPWTGISYRLMAGTSMSTPLTAGAAAVFYEFYRTSFFADPSPALAKAALINGAVDIGLGYPSYAQGWGRIDLRQAIEGPPTGQIEFHDQSSSRLLTTGRSYTLTQPVADSTRLKITLVWTDPPATAGSSSPLRNDLDLIVTSPAGVTYRGNRFTGAWSTPNPGTARDSANNVENVFVQTPATGDWTIEVRAANVAANPPNLTGQDFALVVSGDLRRCTPPPVPTGLVASATAANRIDLSWSGVTGATEYRLYRSVSAGGPYEPLATVPVPATAYTDTQVSGGTTYYYVVRSYGSNGSACESADSNEASATALGDCLLPPLFAGLASVSDLGGGQGCGLRLAWNAATAQCEGPVTYAVYRSPTPGFTPGPANRIAACLSGTAWDDTTMPLDTDLYYLVRAEDGGAAGDGPCNGGNVDTNDAELSGYVNGTSLSGTVYAHDFESATDAPFFDWVDVNFGGTDLQWRGRQSCSGNIFRFGGAGCTADYGRGTLRGREPGGGTGILIAPGSTNLRLTFRHRWQFPTAALFGAVGGGLVGVALDDSRDYTLVPASAISGAGYTDTLSSSCTPGGGGASVWSDTSGGYASATMQTTTIDLDTVCNAITGESGGCAGHRLHVAWIAITPSGLWCRFGTGTGDGWFIDDVAITRDPVAGCTAAPQPVEFLTATGKSTQATLEWLNPAAGPFGSTRLRSSNASFPADPAAGSLVTDLSGIAGEKKLYTHTGLVNGAPVYYAAFANSGASTFSARRTITGLPQATAGNWKWNFATPAAALAPPIQGWGLGVYVPSNDRAFYALGGGAAGGLWKSGYRPAAMNGPAQDAPLVVLAVQAGLPHDAAYVAAQDGYLYCFDAATGAGCTGWPAGGRSDQGFGMVQAQPIFDVGNRWVLFGSRNASGANGFYAVDAQTGATAWAFTNSVAQGGDGQAMGLVSGPALVLGSRAYFASRTRTGGSAHSLWALDFTAGSPTLAWARDLGDIDGSPTHDWTNGRIVVGTNAGSVHALVPATGATAWSRAFGDGAIRTWIYFDPALARLYFTTNTKVWAIPTSGATGSDWSVSGLVSPTRPLLHYGTAQVYLGACTNAACTSGRVIELDGANAWATPKTYDLAGVGGLGPVTIDRTQSPVMLHAGSRSGRVVAVELPLP